MRVRVGRLAVGTMLVTAMVGCSGDETPSPDFTEPRYIASTLVSQQSGEPPELCLGVFLESSGVDCHAIEVRGWTWDGVEVDESGGSWTTAEEYVVVGTFADDALTLTQPAVPARGYDGPTAQPEPSEAEAVSVHYTAERWKNIKRHLSSVPYAYSWSWHEGQLVVYVFIDASGIQERLHTRYGDGAVLVEPVLVPLPGS